MTQSEQVAHFSHDLDALVDRYADEYDLDYASIVGILQMKQWLLCHEATQHEAPGAMD
ncbi:MAG TPA: hypothetical protein VHS96_03835 [Bacteroidia bacterium]|nr:hypothetical protein [Bacteroidia bacterium]